MEFNLYVIGLMASLPQAVQDRCFIAGGALRAFYDATELKDVDLFFRTDFDYTMSLAALRADADFVYKSTCGRTETYTHVPTGRDYNLVGFCWMSPEDTLGRFDFRCCRMAAWLVDGEVDSTVDPLAVEDATIKRLVVLCNNGTERTLRRVTHYVEDYGYIVDGVEIASDEEIGELTQPDEDGCPPRPIDTSLLAKTPRYLLRHIYRLPVNTGGGY